MIYYTTNKEHTLIDSISYDFEALKNKFPNEKIYHSNNRITSIYINGRDEKTYYKIFKIYT